MALFSIIQILWTTIDTPTHTVMKCMRCMTACDKKRIKERLKEGHGPAQ
jgi:polyferredoxin